MGRKNKKIEDIVLEKRKIAKFVDVDIPYAGTVKDIILIDKNMNKIDSEKEISNIDLDSFIDTLYENKRLLKQDGFNEFHFYMDAHDYYYGGDSKICVVGVRQETDDEFKNRIGVILEQKLKNKEKELENLKKKEAEIQDEIKRLNAY